MKKIFLTLLVLGSAAFLVFALDILKTATGL